MIVVFVDVITFRYYFFIGTDRPTLRYLFKHVRPHIIAKWYEIGLELLGMGDESKLQVIREKYPSDHENCVSEMLQLWLQMKVDASWNKLIQAFRQSQIGLSSLASKIENMLGMSIEGTYNYVKCNIHIL